MSGHYSELRLRVKRAFSRYYLDVCSTRIAEPSETFEACAAYFAVRLRQLGEPAFVLQFDNEVALLGGEIEQDLRRRHRTIADCLATEPLEMRFRECADAGRRRSGQR